MYPASRGPSIFLKDRRASARMVISIMLAWKIILFCMQEETNQGHEIRSLVSNRVAKSAIFVFDRVRVGGRSSPGLYQNFHALPLG